MSNNKLIYTADIETLMIKVNDQQIHKPIIISVTNEYKTKSFEIKKTNNIQEQSKIICKSFLDYLSKSGDINNIIYFHNMSNFDGYFILDTLIQNNIKPDIINRYNKILSIKFTNNNKTFHILDSYLMIPYSLDIASQLYNKIYKKQKYNFENINENTLNDKNLKLLKNYCENDTKTLYELITNYNNILINLFNEPIFNSITLPSFSYKLFISNYYKHKFKNLETKHDDFIRNAYFGGIVEIFKPHAKNIISLDINSSYPHVMHDNLYPTSIPKFTKISNDINETLEKYPFSFIKCLIKCKKNNYFPILPYRQTNNSKIIQPTGEWIGTYWSLELKYAISTNYYIIKPISLYYYEKNDVDYIFKEYISFLYNLRNKFIIEKNKPNELLMKKLMNSLYGRTGINVNNVDINIQSIEDFEKKENFELIDYHITDENKIITLDKKEKTTTNTNILLKILKSRVDWAAITTSMARINIHKIITIKNLNVYYTDTDSIFINKKDLNLIKDKISNKLGDLKIVDEADEAIFITPKTYMLINNNNYILKMKGITNNDINLSNNEIKEIFLNKLINNNNSKIIIMNKINNFYKNIKKLSIEQKTIEKSIYTLEYNKRIKIYKNNIWYDTAPINLKLPKHNKTNFIKNIINKIKMIINNIIKYFNNK